MEGLIRVTVQAGRGLASKDSNGFSDPFCRVGVLEHNGKFRKKKKTEVIKKTLNPNWGSDIFQFEVDSNLVGIRVECWDKDTLGKDFLGEVSISLSSLQENPTQEGWFTLEHRKDKPHEEISGQLYLKLHYHKLPTPLLASASLSAGPAGPAVRKLSTSRKEKKELEKRERSMKRLQAKLDKHFQFLHDEVITDAVRCTMDEVYKGKLCLTQFHVLFREKKKKKSNRGKPVQLWLEYQQIRNVSCHDTVLNLATDENTHTFSEGNQIYDVLYGNWQRVVGASSQSSEASTSSGTSEPISPSPKTEPRESTELLAFREKLERVKRERDIKQSQESPLKTKFASLGKHEQKRLADVHRTSSDNSLDPLALEHKPSKPASEVDKLDVASIEARIKQEIMGSDLAPREPAPVQPLATPPSIALAEARGMSRSAPDLNDEAPSLDLVQLGKSEGAPVSKKGLPKGETGLLIAKSEQSQLTERKPSERGDNSSKGTSATPSADEPSGPGVRLYFKWLQYNTKLLVQVLHVNLATGQVAPERALTIFFQLRIGKQIRKTQPVEYLQARSSEEFIFAVHLAAKSKRERFFDLTCWGNDKKKSHRFLGQTLIPLQRVNQHALHPWEHWFPLDPSHVKKLRRLPELIPDAEREEEGSHSFSSHASSTDRSEGDEPEEEEVGETTVVEHETTTSLEETEEDKTDLLLSSSSLTNMPRIEPSDMATPAETTIVEKKAERMDDAPTTTTTTATTTTTTTLATTTNASNGMHEDDDKPEKQPRKSKSTPPVVERKEEERRPVQKEIGYWHVRKGRGAAPTARMRLLVVLSALLLLVLREVIVRDL